MYQEFLQRAGLTIDQANIYEILIKNGSMPAREVSFKSGMKRPLCYKIIDQLIDLGLVNKIDKKVNIFTAAHPDKITDLLIKRQDSLRTAEQSLRSIMGNLISDYNLYSGKPNVRFYEGVAGVEILYDDIILEKKDILLMRSPLDNNRPDLNKIVEKQIKRQVENGIHTRALTPILDDSIETAISHDEMRLVTRCLVPKDKFIIPAQVIIYGDKVAMTSYGEYLVTTIIQNRDIHETFTMIFNLIWSNAEAVSKNLIKGVKP